MSTVINQDACIRIFSLDSGESSLFKEFVYATNDPALVFSNGTIQVLTLLGDGVLSTDFLSGQSVTLYLNTNGFTLDTSGMSLSSNTMIEPDYTNVGTVYKVLGTTYLIIADYFLPSA